MYLIPILCLLTRVMPTDRLETELNGLFGEDAQLVTQTYVETMRCTKWRPPPANRM
jgi:hypothetical protein